MTQFTQTLIAGLSVGSIYALLAVAMNLIIMSADVLNIAVTEYGVLGALAAIALIKAGWPIPLAVVLVVVLAGVGGGLQYDLTIRGTGRTRSAVRTPFVITLAVALIMRGIAQWRWGADVYGLRSFSGSKPLRLGQISIPTQSIWVLASAIAISTTVWLVFNRTLWGKVLRGASQNKDAARLVGINVEWVIRLTFVAAAAVAAFAGLIIVPITFVTYDSGVGFLLYTFIALGIGGFGRTSGAILGGLLVGLLSAFIAGYVSALYSDAIVFALLLGVLSFFPAGLLGRAEDVVTRA